MGRHGFVELLESVNHFQRAARRIGGVVRIVQGRVPERDDGVANKLVDGRLARQQQVTHGGQKRDQEANDVLRCHALGDAREAANVAEQHRHLALFAAQFQVTWIGDDPLDHLGCEIAVESPVDEGAATFFAKIGRSGNDAIGHHQTQNRPCRVDKEILRLERPPTRADHDTDGAQAGHCAQARAEVGHSEGQGQAGDDKQETLKPGSPVRAHQELAKDGLFSRLGVDADPQGALFDWRRHQIAQTDGAGTDKDDLSRERRCTFFGGHLTFQHPPGRNDAGGLGLGVP